MKTKIQITRIAGLIALILLLSYPSRSYSQTTATQDTSLAAADPINNSANWKMGIFYYNPSDERKFPPKPNGMGWTLNFANPLSVASFILLLVVIFIIWKLGRRKQKAEANEFNRN